MMMTDEDIHRIPGLYRLWDLQFVFNQEDDYQIHYVERTADGTPLFAVYRCRSGEVARGLN